MTKINYLINGKEVELEVEDSFAQAYWEIQEETIKAKARERWRRRKLLLSLEGVDELGEYIESPEPNAEERMIGAIEKKILRLSMKMAFNDLKPKQKKLFVAVFVKGINQKVIAEKQGVTESAISQRVDTIRKAYKNNLEKYQKIFSKNLKF